MSTKLSKRRPGKAKPAQPRARGGRQERGERGSRASRTQRRVWSIVGALAVLAALAAIVPFTPVMPVGGIEVQGNRTLSDEQVQELTGIEPETPMGRVDVHQAAENVAANPWVKTVTVKRDWPSSVDVSVEEHEAVAYISQSDGSHLIDRDGEDFLVADPPAEAVELVGSQDEQALKGAVAVAASLSESSRNQIDSIEVGKYTYVLHTVDGRTVDWGAPEDNANKALALDTVLQMEGREFNIANPQLVTSK